VKMGVSPLVGGGHTLIGIPTSYTESCFGELLKAAARGPMVTGSTGTAQTRVWRI